MNAVDKYNEDQLEDESDEMDGVALSASNVSDDDFELLNQAAGFDSEDSDSGFNDGFDDFDSEDSNPDFFDGVRGLNEPHRPYGRWLNDKRTKSLHSRHRHKQFGWSDEDEDNS